MSRQTVSNAVNNPELLRPDTLARVQDAIAELGYSPNRAARNLRTRASHLIGMRFKPAQEGTANAAMDRFVHSLVDTAGDSGYHVLLFAGAADDPVGGYDELLRSTAVDAFIVTDTYLGNPQAAWLTRRAPFVAFGRPWDNPEAPHAWVDVDGAAGAELATNHLLDRGHTRIAWIGWRKDSFIGEDRRSGWTRAMHARGPADDGAGIAGRGHRRLRPRGGVGPARRGPALRLRLRLGHPGDGSAAHARRARPRLGPRRRGGRLRRLPGGPGRAAGLTSVRQPLEQVAVEVVEALEGLLGHPP